MKNFKIIMTMITTLKKLCVISSIAILLLIPSLSFADGPGGPGAGNGSGSPSGNPFLGEHDPSAPVGDGYIFSLTLGLFYGAYNLYKSRRKSKDGI